MLKGVVADLRYRKYKVDDAVETTKNYTIQRGDYLLADGNLLPKGTALTEEQKAKVAAIVFWTPAETDPTGRTTPAALSDDKIMAKDFPHCTHGLAVSIKNASDNGCWQNVGESVADFQRGTNFNPTDKADYTSIATSTSSTDFNRIHGYQNTKVLWAYNDYCKANSKADALVKPAETLKSFTTQHPAPANSTGWFLPSPKELHMLCYKDVDDIHQATRPDNTETIYIVEASLSALSRDASILSPRKYWSSSENELRTGYAYGMEFYHSTVLTIAKNNSRVTVRAVCAF